jgi:hypothetical protein
MYWRCIDRLAKQDFRFSCKTLVRQYQPWTASSQCKIAHFRRDPMHIVEGSEYLAVRPFSLRVCISPPSHTGASVARHVLWTRVIMFPLGQRPIFWAYLSARTLHRRRAHKTRNGKTQHECETNARTGVRACKARFFNGLRQRFL